MKLIVLFLFPPFPPPQGTLTVELASSRGANKDKGPHTAECGICFEVLTAFNYSRVLFFMQGG